jgi:sporulation protein YlmC with PRC-barrel domain
MTGAGGSWEKLHEEVHMKRTLMAVAAVGGLMVSTALAQTPSTPNSSSQPSASPSTMSPSGSMSSTSSPGSAAAISQQSSDQWLFSKFNGTDVVGTDDAKIGDVSDVLFDKSGQVDALIVGVGGFLGIGSKDVALPITAFQVVPGTNGAADKLRLSMTKDQLQQHAEFKPLTAPTTTTGSAGSPANRPTTAPAR